MCWLRFVRLWREAPSIPVHCCAYPDWNIRATFFEGKETADNTIQTLGAYICFARIGDRKEGKDLLLGEGDLGYVVEPEFMPQLHFHRRGVLAAAREGDDVNPAKASSASQFYIVWGRVYTKEQLDDLKELCRRRFDRELVITPEQEAAYTTVGGTPHLDGEYTVFGEVISGLEVVEKIQTVPCDGNDRPLDDIRILKTEIIK